MVVERAALVEAARGGEARGAAEWAAVARAAAERAAAVVQVKAGRTAARPCLSNRRKVNRKQTGLLRGRPRG